MNPMDRRGGGRTGASSRRRDFAILLLMLAATGVAAALPGCSKRAPTAPTAASPLRVEVRLPVAHCASCASTQGGPIFNYAIDSLRISAFEILTHGLALRARQAVEVKPFALVYQISIRAPFAARYLIAVEAIGRQTRAYPDSTLQGTQYYGEGVLSTTPSPADPLTIDMVNVVSLSFITYSALEIPSLSWCRVPHATGYVVRGSTPGRPDTSLSVADTTLDIRDLSGWTLRVRAELHDGIHAAFSEAGQVEFAPDYCGW